MKTKRFGKLFRPGHRLAAVLLGIVSLMLAAPSVLEAQPAWPAKPITAVVPYPVGGIIDVVTRIVTGKIAPVLGQPIVVESRPGNDGNIGTASVAHSPADGYTWLVNTVPFTTQVSLRPYALLRYDPIKDFRHVAQLSTCPNVFVVPNKLPVKTLKEFIAYAKSRPVPLSYATTGNGTTAHLGTLTFMRATGIEMLHVPYKGQSPAFFDVLAGRVDFMNLALIAALPQIKAGKLKALAMVDTERDKQLPDLPTIVEEGYPDVIVVPWQGLFMPAKTPDEIVQRVNAEVMKALQSPDVVEKMQNAGITPAKPNRPEDFEKMIKAEVARFAKLIKEANIKPD
jgi:tripartite-type tricarboxylate transporter receptor subunit TctC